MARLD